MEKLVGTLATVVLVLVFPLHLIMAKRGLIEAKSSEWGNFVKTGIGYWVRCCFK